MVKEEQKVDKVEALKGFKNSNMVWIGFQLGFGVFTAMLVGFIILGLLTSLIWLFVR